MPQDIQSGSVESQRTPTPHSVRKLFRLTGLLGLLQISRTTFYGHVRDGTFTPGVKLGDRVVVWPADEVETLVTAYIAGESTCEIRALVAELLAVRKRKGAPSSTEVAV